MQQKKKNIWNYTVCELELIVFLVFLSSGDKDLVQSLLFDARATNVYNGKRSFEENMARE